MTTDAPQNQALDTALSVIAVDWDDPRAEALRAQMSAELYERYAALIAEWTASGGDAVADALKDDITADIVAHTVIAELDGVAVGHATLIRSRAEAHLGELEVKRVFTAESARRRGVSIALLAALEKWAAAQGAPRLILGTGPEQPEAIALYPRIGYVPLKSYAPQPWTDRVFCFEKSLTPPA